MIQTQPNCTDRVETGLIHFDTARANILSSVTAIGGAHRLPIEQARGRTLACAVTAPIDVPAHTNSAVDGYALRSEDLPGSGTTGRFTIVGRAFAGKPFEGELAAGQCVRIMTGAPMPKARALEPIRKRPGRTEVQRGILLRDDDGAWTVKTTGKQGSSILRSMSLADAFIILPHDSGNIDADDSVTVQPFAGLW